VDSYQRRVAGGEIPTVHATGRANGLSTSGPAATTACRAREAGRLCPYREHALISHQEHEAWNVLLACQGQLRLASSGHVIGIDMNAALTLGAVRGCDLAVLSELLPAAQAGLVEILQANSQS
jgi:hypothetical protein